MRRWRYAAPVGREKRYGPLEVVDGDEMTLKESFEVENLGSLANPSKTEQTAVLISGDGSADGSVVELELREVCTESCDVTPS